jgi:hypothetical protein
MKRTLSKRTLATLAAACSLAATGLVFEPVLSGSTTTAEARPRSIDHRRPRTRLVAKGGKLIRIERPARPVTQRPTKPPPVARSRCSGGVCR